MKNFFDLPQVKTTPGQLVRAFRTNFRITLRELQDVTGISYTNLSAIEHGRIEIGVRRAILLAAAFGLEPEQILFPQGYERPEHKDVERVRHRAKRLFDKKREMGLQRARGEVQAKRGRSLVAIAKDVGIDNDSRGDRRVSSRASTSPRRSRR